MKRSPIQRRAYVTRRCETCGATFERRADHRPRNARGAVLCLPCSRKDRAVGRSYPQRKTGRELTCEVCGKGFYRKASAIASRNARFCSKTCWGVEQRRNPRPWVGQVDNSGERNGRYRHGRRVGERVTKPRVRAEVAERDGDWCLLCGMPPKGLHLHRVVYGAHGGKYEATNCVQLCSHHHGVVHGNKRVWQPLLLAYLANDDRQGVLARCRSLIEQRRAG